MAQADVCVWAEDAGMCACRQKDSKCQAYFFIIIHFDQFANLNIYQKPETTRIL